MERYPGLLDLIEEFEHLSLATEEPDQGAVIYFKRQKRLREQGFEVGGFKMEDLKVETTEAMGSVGGRGSARLDENEMGSFPEMEDVKSNHLSEGDEVKDTSIPETGGPENGEGDRESMALNGERV